MGTLGIPAQAMHDEHLDHLISRWKRGELEQHDVEVRLEKVGYTRQEIRRIIRGEEP